MSQSTMRRPTVLIIQEDRSTRCLLEQTLDRLGYPWLNAADGEEAWTLLHQCDARIVVADWGTRRLDGLELCRWIRASQRETYTHVILLTSRDDQADLVNGLEAGADDYIGRPLDQNELQVRLEVACRTLRLEDRLREQNRTLLALNAQLEQTATTDALMGIGNRRCLELAAHRIHALCDQQGRSYGVLMVDVDEFKRYNDHYGYHCGDQVLIRIARCVREHLRLEDEVYRYGGEELAVVLPVIEVRDLEVVAERLRCAVLDLCIPHNSSELGQVSVSIGGALLTPGMSASDFGTVLERAGQSLAQAKRGGRNRSCLWNPPPDGQPSASAPGG